ncbi:MAG: hypothetical protein DRI90_08300 [Deltaproteobacteria bacterium]|nr:MAG: hypothetical protein DRI90_08300 [Deltaproteobacteria bacterium]
MGDDEDKGGIVLGGISFGDGMPAKPADGAKEKKGSTTTAGSEVNTRGPATRPAALGDALLPLRAVAVADLMPRDEYNAGANPPEHATRIEVGHFDELFKRLLPRLAIEVESVLLDGGMARVDLSPVAIKSFRPDSLIREVPLLRSLLDGKRVLERLRDGSTTIEAAASELNRLWNGSSLVGKVLGGVEVKQAGSPSPAAPEPTDTGPGDVARILDMVDTGTKADDVVASGGPAAPATPSAGATTKGRFDGFIAAVAKSGKGQPGARPDQGIRTIEKALSLQLGAIVQHPEVHRLEETWRGLSFLAGRTPKEGVQLEVVSARPANMAAALERAIAANTGIEPPVSFAVVDTLVEGDAASLAQWRQLAEVCEASCVPCLANATPSLLGQSDLDGIDRLDNKQGLFDTPQQVPWRSEAARPATLWSSLALNRVLVRSAYDKRTSRVREATVEELPADDGATIWMQPCWAVASLIMRSFAKTGWPCNITGARDTGIIEDLPVREVPLGYEGSEHAAIPTEVFFSTETQRALGRIGILALASQPNSDAAYLLSAATAYVPPPKRTQDYDTAEPEMRLPRAPLGDQLFVARVVQFLQALGGRLATDSDPGEVKQVLEAALGELFDVAPPSGPEISVDVTSSPSGLSASVTVRPRRFLGVQMEEITLGVPLN